MVEAGMRLAAYGSTNAGAIKAHCAVIWQVFFARSLIFHGRLHCARVAKRL